MHRAHFTGRSARYKLVARVQRCTTVLYYCRPTLGVVSMCGYALLCYCSVDCTIVLCVTLLTDSMVTISTGVSAVRVRVHVRPRYFVLTCTDVAIMVQECVAQW